MYGPQRYLNLQQPALNAVLAQLAADGMRPPTLVRWRYQMVAYAQSAGWSALQKRVPEAMPAAPCFIAGFWRSGTTLLHERLALDPRWRWLRTHQCMNPLSVLSPPLPGSRTVSRPMDELTIDGNSPQECEFALLMQGVPSFYQVLLAPQAWPRLLRYLDPARMSEAERQRRCAGLSAFLRLASLGDSRPFLLKSPTHGFALDELACQFPGMQAVVILRDPLDTLASNLGMWPRLFELYALASWRMDQLVDDVLAAYSLYVERMLSAARRFDSAQLAVVFYEDLVAEPLRLIQALHHRFDWQFSVDFEAGLRADVAARAGYRRRGGQQAAALDQGIASAAKGLHQRLLAGLGPFQVRLGKT